MGFNSGFKGLTCINVTLYVHCLSFLYWGRINTGKSKIAAPGCDALRFRSLGLSNRHESQKCHKDECHLWQENKNLAYCSCSVLAVWLLWRREVVTGSRLPFMGMWRRVVWYKCIGILEGLAAFMVKEHDGASDSLLHAVRLMPYYGFTSQETTVFCHHHQGKWWSGKFSEPLVHTLHCMCNCIPLLLIVLVAVQIFAAL